jgi:hypothetical protein
VTEPDDGQTVDLTDPLNPVWPPPYIPDPGGNADGHIDYPDIEAPASPERQAANLLGAMYQTNIWVDGKLTYQPSCPPLQTDDPGDSIEAHRDQVRALLFFLFWDRRRRPFVVMQTRDLALDRWIDLTSDTPPAIDDWDGMVTVDVRVNAGWGDSL